MQPCRGCTSSKLVTAHSLSRFAFAAYPFGNRWSSSACCLPQTWLQSQADAHPCWSRPSGSGCRRASPPCRCFPCGCRCPPAPSPRQPACVAALLHVFRSLPSVPGPAWPKRHGSHQRGDRLSTSHCHCPPAAAVPPSLAARRHGTARRRWLGLPQQSRCCWQMMWRRCLLSCRGGRGCKELQGRWPCAAAVVHQ